MRRHLKLENQPADCIPEYGFHAKIYVPYLRSNAHDVDVLHHREATTPNYFLDGTGVGALPNKPEDRTACLVCCAWPKPVISPAPSVVAYRGAFAVAEPGGWLIPRALHCLVERVWWRILCAGANTPPVFNPETFSDHAPKLTGMIPNPRPFHLYIPSSR